MANVDNPYVVLGLITLAVCHHQGHIITMGSEAAALFNEDPGVVTRVNRSEANNFNHSIVLCIFQELLRIVCLYTISGYFPNFHRVYEETTIQ